MPRPPHDVLDGVVLLPQVLVEGPDGFEVASLNGVELEPRGLLLQAAECKRVLARRVENVGSDHCNKNIESSNSGSCYRVAPR